MGAPPVSRQCNKYPEVLNRKQIADGRTDGRTAEREKEDGDATRMGIWSGDGEREGGGRRERERERGERAPIGSRRTVSRNRYDTPKRGLRKRAAEHVR